MQNLTLRHIYKNSFPVFSAVSSAVAFKVCEKCSYDQKNLKNARWVSNNAEFDADFESVEINRKAKIGRNGSKKNEKLIYECVLESYFTYISGLGGSISQISQNRCSLMYSVYTELEFLNNLWGQ